MKQLRIGMSPVTLLTAGHFLSDFYNNFLPALLPSLIAKTGISLASAGVLVMLYYIASCILQPVCGYFIDKKGYAGLILITLPLSALFICFVDYAPGYFGLIAFISLAGLGSSLFHPLGSSLVAKLANLENKGFALSIFIGGGNFGFAVAPIIVIYLITKFGLSCLPWLLLPAAALSAAFYYQNLHKVSLAVPVTTDETNTVAWYKSLSLLKLNIVMALRSWSQMALPNFLPILLAQKGHPPLLAGKLLTVYLTGGAVGGLIGGWLGDKLGRKTSIVIMLAACLPAMYLFFANDEITPVSWLILAFCGATLQGTMPSSIIWAQDIIPKNAAMASGMMLGLSFGLGGVGVAVTGAAADMVGLKTSLIFSSILPLALAVPLAAIIPAGGQKETD